MRKIDKNKISKILVISLSNVGDIILTTPVVEALLKNYAGAKLDLIVGPSGKDIFQKHKKISKVFIYDKHSNLFEKFRLIKKLRNMRYSMVVDLKNTIIPFLIGAKYASSPFGRSNKKIHKIDQHLNVIKSMGIDVKDARPNIEIGETDSQKIDSLVGEISKDFVIVSCGAKSHTKRWPEEYFAFLSDLIKKDLKYDIVLVGKDEGYSMDSDRVIADNVKRNMKETSLDLIGKTNLRELAALIKKAKLLITNDSAPLHVASAVNTPVVAIFGPTDENKYGPLSDKSIVLRKKLKCAPCEKAQCRFNYECMRNITVEDALSAIKEILAS